MKRNNKTNRKAASKRTFINPGLFIVPQVDANPRRKGSFGYKSMNVILNARKPLTVEKFAGKGGRLRDLHWDINAGHAKLAKKAS